jgi:hypothetical protein
MGDAFSGSSLTVHQHATWGMFVATVFVLVVRDNEHTYLLIYMGNCLDMYATVYVMKIVYFQSDANSPQ